MKIKMKRVVDGQQGYWSIIVLQNISEEFMDHPLYGRVRITSCSETETHCGFGSGCFAVTETTFPQEPMLVRALQLKKAGWVLMQRHISNNVKRALIVGALIFFDYKGY